MYYYLNSWVYLRLYIKDNYQICKDVYNVKKGVKMKKISIGFLRFIINVDYLISGVIVFILTVSDGVKWLSSDALLDMLGVKPTEGALTVMSFTLFSVFAVLTIAVFTVSFKLTILSAKIGILALPVLCMLSGLTLSVLQTVIKFLITAVFVWVFIKITGALQKNSDRFYTSESKKTAFIIYTGATVAAQICLVVINLLGLPKSNVESNEALTTVLGITAFIGIMLMVKSSFWLSAHNKDNVLTYISVFSQALLYTVFYSINISYIDIDRSVYRIVFIVLFLLSGVVGIWRYRKTVQCFDNTKSEI